MASAQVERKYKYDTEEERVRKILAREHFGHKNGPDAHVSSVGLVVDVEPSTSIKFVRKLIKGGPAARLGTIKEGDIVKTLNGQVVQSMNLQEVFPLMLAAERTQCKAIIALAAQSGVTMELSRRTGGAFSGDGDDLEMSCVHDTEYSVSFSPENIAQQPEDALAQLIYLKGHGSFLRGEGPFRSKEKRRWVAVRQGRLIVMNDNGTKVSKTYEISRAQLHPIFVVHQEPRHTFFGIKPAQQQTLYFGDNDPNVVRTIYAPVLEMAEMAARRSFAEFEPLELTPVPLQRYHVRYPQHRKKQTGRIRFWRKPQVAELEQDAAASALGKFWRRVQRTRGEETLTKGAAFFSHAPARRTLSGKMMNATCTRCSSPYYSHGGRSTLCPECRPTESSGSLARTLSTK